MSDSSLSTLRRELTRRPGEFTSYSAGAAPIIVALEKHERELKAFQSTFGTTLTDIVQQNEKLGRELEQRHSQLLSSILEQVDAKLTHFGRDANAQSSAEESNSRNTTVRVTLACCWLLSLILAAALGGIAERYSGPALEWFQDTVVSPLIAE